MFSDTYELAREYAQKATETSHLESVEETEETVGNPGIRVSKRKKFTRRRSLSTSEEEDFTTTNKNCKLAPAPSVTLPLSKRKEAQVTQYHFNKEIPEKLAPATEMSLPLIVNNKEPGVRPNYSENNVPQRSPVIMHNIESEKPDSTSVGKSIRFYIKSVISVSPCP